MALNTGYLTASKTEDNMIGKKFGRLTVIERLENGKGFTKRYKCICDCGNIKNIYKSNLTCGLTQSCGCIQKEILTERNRKENKYQEKEGFIVGFDSNGNTFKIDKSDLERVSKLCWVKCKNGYYTAQYNGSKVLLHRFIMNAMWKTCIDHINHDKSDNRKSNLRFVSQSENSANQRIRSDNKSGKKGVYFNDITGKWLAVGVKNYKQKKLGRFDTFIEACDARTKWENSVQKEFAYDERLDVMNNG